MNIKLIHQGFIHILLAVATSVAILAQQPAQPAPNAERLRSHITYLASDALEGRRTGSSGAQGAAQYIAGEFSRLGLRHGSEGARADRTRGEAKSRYLQQFPYVAGVQLGKANTLRVVPLTPAGSNGGGRRTTAVLEFRAGEEWTPLGLSSNSGMVEAPIAFVNYGITAVELKYDDYAGKPVTGHIAIAFAGTPDGDNPHGRFARYEDVRWKAIAARNAGAKGLLVIAREENFKLDPLSRLRYDNSGGDAGLPVALISRQGAERMLQASGVLGSVSELESLVREVIAAATGPGLASENDRALQPKLLGAVRVTLQVDLIRREVAATNVIGILDGSDPALKNEAIVIGAHYDHLGRGGPGSLAQREGDVHHGADDNASGVAGILELARAFSSQRPKPRRTIVFIAFGGEEEGLLGSNYYVNHPLVPLANTVAMINLDMIGRLKNKNLIIGGVGSAPEWRAMIESANLSPVASGNAVARSQPASASINGVQAANGGTVVGSDVSRQFSLTLNEDGYGPSDHSSFYGKQIPVLFFWTGTHEDYHKPSDTADKINYVYEARILGVVGRIVRDVDMSDKRPTYTLAKSASTGRATGFRVYLGTIPNYADSSDGLLLDGVREDSPAATAGLRAGDRIVKLAGRDVRSVYDYTYALGEMKAGQEYEVEVMRGAERRKLRLTPAARK